MNGMQVCHLLCLQAFVLRVLDLVHPSSRAMKIQEDLVSINMFPACLATALQEHNAEQR